MTTPFPFVAGQVLTAAQLNDIQNLPISDKTASYTLVAADVYKRTIMNNASATTITVNNSIFTVGDVIQVANKGAGACTITAGAGVTINTTGTLILAQYGGGYLLALSASTFTFFKLGGAAAPSLTIDYLVVAGGAGGGNANGSTFNGGGGGAGGVRSTVATSGDATTLETAFTPGSGTVYTITVGAGGASNTSGTDSSIAGSGLTTITSTGGGRGGGTNAPATGGSGGGGNNTNLTGAAGTANQGRAGGTTTGSIGGGGGGASNTGGNPTVVPNGFGGVGVVNVISGSSVYYGGGGGGHSPTATVNAGGNGGGGNGGASGTLPQAGTANRGGGGGGRNDGMGAGAGGAGGSGIIIVRTLDTFADPTTLTVGTKTTSGGYKIYTFLATGTIAWTI